MAPGRRSSLHKGSEGREREGMAHFWRARTPKWLEAECGNRRLEGQAGPCNGAPVETV